MISAGINILVLILLIATFSKLDDLARAIRQLHLALKPPAEDRPPAPEGGA
jgi:hypothetical protein